MNLLGAAAAMELGIDVEDTLDAQLQAAAAASGDLDTLRFGGKDGGNSLWRMSD
jgi:hypothetical protein